MPEISTPVPAPMVVQNNNLNFPEKLKEVSRVVGTIGTGEDIRDKRNLPGVIPDARAIAGVPKKHPESSVAVKETSDAMSPTDFARLLALDTRRKQKRSTSGSTGSTNLGGSRTNPSG